MKPTRAKLQKKKNQEQGVSQKTGKSNSPSANPVKGLSGESSEKTVPSDGNEKQDGNPKEKEEPSYESGQENSGVVAQQILPNPSAWLLAR